MRKKTCQLRISAIERVPLVYVLNGWSHENANDDIPINGE